MAPQQTRVQTDPVINPIEVQVRAPSAPNLSQGWQRPSDGDNDFQQLANALSSLSPTLTNYANKQERLQQQEQLSKAQMEFARAKMDGTMEPLRKAVRDGQLPEGDNPWLNVFRKKLIVANDVNDLYRAHLNQQAALLKDPDATPDAVQNAYTQAKQTIQPLLDSSDPVIQTELIERVAEANLEFENTVARNRSEAVVEKTQQQAQVAISGFIDGAIEGGAINRPLFNNQVGGLLKQAKQMGVQNVNELLMESVKNKARQLGERNPDAALSLIEAARDYSPMPGATIGQIPRYAEQLDNLANKIEADSAQKIEIAVDNYRESMFENIDKALLERAQKPEELEKIAEEFEQQARAEGFNVVSFDIRDHIAKRTSQLTKTLEYVDNRAISDVQRLAYTGEIDEAQTVLNAAENIPFDTRMQLTKLIQMQQKTIDSDKVDNFKTLIEDAMYAPGAVDVSLFPAPDLEKDTGNVETELQQKKAEVLQGVAKMRTKLISQFAAQHNMSVAQTLNDPGAMSEIDGAAREFIDTAIGDFATKFNRRNQQHKELQQRKVEIENAAVPWKLTELFRDTDTNLRNLDAVRLRLLSKPSTAYTEDAKNVKSRWMDAVANANNELDRLAGSMLNGMKPEQGSNMETLSNEEMTRRVNEVSLKTYHKLHDAIGWSLDEIRKGYSRHGITFSDTDINPFVTRIVANVEEFKALKGSEELLSVARRFNLPPEVLVAAQADLLGLDKID